MLTLPLRPYLRLSIGLIVLTLSILLIGESLGIVPDKSQIILDHRKKLTEILAEQYALGAEKKDLSQIEAALNALVKKIQKYFQRRYAKVMEHFMQWLVITKLFGKLRMLEIHL